jgi:hypothetical protein
VLARGAPDALAFPLGFATVGLLVSLRRPANPIGWLYADAGLVWALEIPGRPWLEHLLGAHRALPLAPQLAATFGDVVYAPAVSLGVTLPLLLPEGRLRSPRWRPAAAASLTGALLIVVGALKPTQLVSIPLANPLALHGWGGTTAQVADSVGGVLLVGSLVASLVCVVLRFRSSVGVERQQLRWVAAAVVGVLTATALLLGGALLGSQRAPGRSPCWRSPCMPASVAVAVLRYRLWDLDRLVSRTVTYALVTALLVLPYLLILPVATRLAQGSGSLAVAAATLAVAAAFQPVNPRVQELVDRRFNRACYDAARTVDGFAVRLRDQVDLDALSVELLAVVHDTIQPTRASLWLRPPAAPRPPR